ncbi:hypothetical protein GCM10011519_05600 [Marmoricola endophyticus]|uniref:Uncharacterized protein n=1 Tax=Marmoricola endophyticus TaxID=2040280 RepID=A0A917BB73_9ACTN|nr:hypothetical protein [Marmoricola endophyticus]GGF35022.1 hypothetical protein GCM10011519_05600 [Marmoricola endophyticus]
MFWIIAAIVVIVGLIIAWVTSGRMGPGGVGQRNDPKADEARAAAYRNNIRGGGGGAGGGF